MNMLALTWGDTTIVVDAGVMFPDPELLGVDRIIPDLTYLQQKGGAAALVLTHGHEDHIGGVPHVLPLVDGPIYGTPLTLALVEPKLDEHGLEDAQPLHAVRPRDRVDDRSVRDRVHPRHAQHARLRRAGHPHAGRRRRPHRRLQDRPDADRRRALRRPPVRRARRRGRAGAVRRQHQHRPPRLHRLGDSRSSRRSRRSSRARTGRIIVAAFASSIYRMQILVDLAAQFDRKVAFVGRGMIENSRDRAAARLPADSGRRADPRFRGRRAIPRRTCCA